MSETRLCKDCVHSFCVGAPYLPYEYKCRKFRLLEPVLGDEWINEFLCAANREKNGFCTPDGLYWEAK